MKKIIKVLSVLLLVVAMATLVGCGSKKTDLEKVQETKILNVGITMYKPMDYLGEDGETFIGFDADLANEFAESIGARARFILIKWDSKVMELNGGYIDLIWNGMTASDELGENIDFSTAYATNYQCVVVKNTNTANYNTVDDIKGKQVAVESGSAGDTVASEYVTPNRVTAQLDALNEVKSGNSDCAIIDYTMAYSIVGNGEYTDLAIIDATKISFENEVFAVGARKGSDLVVKLNEFFANKYADGSLKAKALEYGVAVNEAAFK